MPWSLSVFRQAQHALAEDVAEDLGGARPDSAPPREQTVELPLALVRRPLAAARDLRVRADHLGGHFGQLLVHLAPEQLRGRALRARRLALEDLGEAAVAVELEDALLGTQLGDLLPQHRIVGGGVAVALGALGEAE